MGDDDRREFSRRALRIRGVERDLDAELGFHFAETVEELMAEGLSRADAEREARRRFGDEPRYRRDLATIDRAAERRRRMRGLLDATAETFRSALRGVRRSPGLSAGIAFAFALGIGANATMFGTVERLMLRPPDGILDPDGVVRLWAERVPVFGGGERGAFPSFTYPDYQDLRAASSFASIGAYGTARFTLGHGVDASEVQARVVTASFWEVLGARPVLGRVFTEAEDARGGEPLALISYGLWQRRFGGDRGVLGRELDFGHARYTVIGVTPKSFTGSELAPVDVWVPLHVDASLRMGDYWVEARRWWWVSIVARLAPGASPESAAAQATALHRAGRRELIDRGEERPDPTIVPASLILARGPSPAPEIAVSRWLAAVSLIVLLIACANVANLLIARSLRQRRETGIRLALGISHPRLIGQLLAEGVLLACLGGAAALLVTYWSAAFVRRLLLPDVVWGDPVNGTVVAFVVAVAIGAGLVSALVPALHTARQAVAGVMRDTAGGINLSATRLRGWLSVLQAALSVVLLVGAGLFVRSLNRVRSLDLGLDPARVLLVHPVFAQDGIFTERHAMDDAERALFFERASRDIARLPGVERVALSEVVPFMGGIATTVRAAGVDSIPRPASDGPYIYKVGPGFFDVLGLEIRRGRPIDDTDRMGVPQVAVVNESMAAHLWPHEDALGRCLHVGEAATECTRIVGVVEDARRQSIHEEAQLIYYVPMAQRIAMEVSGAEAFLIRTRSDPAPLADAVRRVVLGADARVRFAEARPLQELIDPQLRSWKLGATMFTIFGVLALVVAAIGLYAVLSFDVVQRTREIGLRSALGATRPSIVRIFLGRALRLTAAGTAVGLAAAIALAPRVEELLYETSPRDSTTLIGVAACLLLVAVVAATIPAWRAARVDPGVALRAQ